MMLNNNNPFITRTASTSVLGWRVNWDEPGMTVVSALNVLNYDITSLICKNMHPRNNALQESISYINELHPAQLNYLYGAISSALWADI